MSLSDMFDSLNVLFSAVAILVSVGAAFLAWRTSAKQNALQARIVSIEESREHDRLQAKLTAKMRASLTREVPDRREQLLLGKRPDVYLLLQNVGDATALRVRVTLDGVPLAEHDLVPRGQGEMTTFGAGASTSYILAPGMGTPGVVKVCIHWNDESGFDGQWESELKL